MKIRERLILGFIGTSLLLGFVSYTCKMTNSEIRRSTLIVSESLKQEVKGSSDMLLALQATQIAIHELLEAQEITVIKENQPVKSTLKNEQLEKIQKNLEQAENSLFLSKRATEYGIKNYQAIGDAKTVKQWQEELEVLATLEKELAIYKFSISQLIKKDKKNTITVSNFIKSNLEKQYKTKLLPLLNDYINGREEELVSQSNQVIEIINAAEQQIMIATVFTLVATILTGTLISHSILSPLKKLKEAAEQIGKGGMNIRVDIKSKDEIEILANAFNQMMDDLSRTTVDKYYVDQIINSMTDSLISTLR